MPRIKLTKTPKIQERLIDIKGQTISDLNLEGSFALNLKRNEPFITYDSLEEAWFLETSTEDIPWIHVPLFELQINGHNNLDNVIIGMFATSIGIQPNLNYFSNKPVYFKYKVSGSTVHIQYMFALDLPTAQLPNNDDNQVQPAPYELTKIRINLAAIDPVIFNSVDDSVGNYFLDNTVQGFQQAADGLQMCYYENNQLVFTCNNHTSGHNASVTQFNYDILNNGLLYSPLKMVLCGSYMFEKVMT